MSIRSLVRKNTIIHGVVSGIYRNTFYLLKTGYLKGIMAYHFNVAAEEQSKLRNDGFDSITPFSKRSWRFGGGMITLIGDTMLPI